MKIAITGKGGVGKTAVAAGLARAWCDAGRSVTAVDADPDANLAATLGHRGDGPQPLVALRQLIEERVGGWGGFLKLNPRVDDIPERFGIDVAGVRVLLMGTIDRGRRGCACAENVLLREVLNHLLVDEHERVVVDMEAGLEHLGRGTTEGVDELWTIVEPGWASIQTAQRAAALARDLGIARVGAVANKIETQEDVTFVRESLADLPLWATLPLDRELARAARSGAVAHGQPFRQAIADLAART